MLHPDRNGASSEVPFLVSWHAGTMGSPPTITPLADATFGATVTQIDVRSLDHASFAELYASWLEVGLLVFPGQFLDQAAQNRFARRFGDLEFEASPLSNVRRDGTLRPTDGSDDMMQILIGNMGWHQDSTYMPVQAKGAVFSAEIVPLDGGATGFADTASAYDALDRSVKDRIAGLRARHSLYHSQARVGHDATSTHYSGYGFHDGPVSIRPIVKRHPETGRRSLTIGRHAFGIEGLDTTESEELLASLVNIATEPRYTYHHQWSAGDVVVWDNRRLLHCATPWDVDRPRVMWHTRIAGDPASESAA